MIVARTGTTKIANRSAPARAKTIVSAIGRNSSPSMLVSDSNGT